MFREIGLLAEVPDGLAARVEGLVLMRVPLRACDLPRFPRLRVVVTQGVGYDHIDIIAGTAAGLSICNVPDYGTNEVADHALALMLALCRGIGLHHQRQRVPLAAAWEAVSTPAIRRLTGRSLGVVGLGRIGTAAALRAQAFGMRIVFYDPDLPDDAGSAFGFTRCHHLGALAEHSDVLSLHAPLTAETRGMINADVLSRLPPGALVINTARGPLLDLAALYDAMQRGAVAAAGLDVIEVEPPADPLPALLADYRAGASWLDGRLIVTPHAAFYSPQGKADMRRKAAETMAAALAGRPRNLVRP